MGEFVKAKYNDPVYIGKRYNMLTVLEPVHHVLPNGRTAWFWRVRCDCGNEKVIRPIEVVSGRNVSCGCYRASGANAKKNIVHGDSHTRLHDIWCGINNRCNPDHANTGNYGKLGISVCDEWRDYSKFAEWALSHGYSDELSIERKDVMGDYCPENCEWIPMKAQARNRTTTLWVEYQGRRMSLAEAAELAGLPYKQVHYRIKHGWSVEKALSEPLKQRSALYEECLKRGVDYNVVYKRIIAYGWDKERAFTEPTHPRRACKAK